MQANALQARNFGFFESHESIKRMDRNGMPDSRPQASEGRKQLILTNMLRQD
jgi:hypothetical protein